MSVQVEVLVNRPVEEVFEYLDDVSREHEWQPNLTSAHQEPPGATRVGSAKRYSSSFLGKEVVNTYVVTKYEPFQRIVCETDRDSAVAARTEVTCEPEGSGTRVLMTLDGKPRGALRFVPGKVLEMAYREQLNAAVANLKERLEASP